MTNTQQDKRGWVLAALMITMTLAGMDITFISSVVPQIVSDLGGFTMFSWVFSIYLLAQTVIIPLYGKLSDLYGRKKSSNLWYRRISNRFSSVWICLGYS